MKLPSRHSTAISLDGYGDHTSPDGHGYPLLLDYHEGKLQILVWADINQEDPTHTIDLSGALESNRKEDT